MERHFVRLTSDGIVNQDLIFDGPGAPTAAAPNGMVEITGHPQWQGMGSLLGHTFVKGSFVAPPEVQAPVVADPILDRLAQIEAALATLNSKIS